jgi:hypothetical protein
MCHPVRGCRAPISSKGKQKVNAVSYWKQGIELRTSEGEMTRCTTSVRNVKTHMGGSRVVSVSLPFTRRDRRRGVKGRISHQTRLSRCGVYCSRCSGLGWRSAGYLSVCTRSQAVCYTPLDVRGSCGLGRDAGSVACNLAFVLVERVSVT